MSPVTQNTGTQVTGTQVTGLKTRGLTTLLGTDEQVINNLSNMKNSKPSSLREMCMFRILKIPAISIDSYFHTSSSCPVAIGSAVLNTANAPIVAHLIHVRHHRVTATCAMRAELQLP
jgi:hypothetical protein